MADIEVLKRLVYEAGNVAAQRRGKVGVEYKADESLVTDVDRDTERFLEAELNKRYPGFAFVGEEYGWRGPKDVPVWACDPIDGTTNYVNGLPHWCVSVGLLQDGVPLLGAMYLPVLNELFWAVRGEGAYCNGTRLMTTDRDSLHVEDTLCMTSNSLKTLSIDHVGGRLRCLGSIASELAYTARGNLRATIGLREGIVDMAAGLCMCFEAGCELRYLSGTPVDIQALVHARRTDEHFLYGPPRMLSHLISVLKPAK